MATLPNPQLGLNTVTIANGAHFSGTITLNGGWLESIVMDVGWDAAGLSFQGSHDNVTFYPIYDGFGNEVTLTVAAGRAVVVPLDIIRGWEYVQLVSGQNSGSYVNQTALRTLVVASRWYH